MNEAGVSGSKASDDDDDDERDLGRGVSGSRAAIDMRGEPVKIESYKPSF